MTAPAPSPAEQAVIDRFAIFEPEARVVEEVAPIVLNVLLNLRTDKGPYSGEAALEVAAAAVAGYRAAQEGGAEEAVRRCGSRGPRIGSEGQPICRQSEGHAGSHRPAVDDGWGDVTWSDPR